MRFRGHTHATKPLYSTFRFRIARVSGLSYFMGCLQDVVCVAWKNFLFLFFSRRPRISKTIELAWNYYALLIFLSMRESFTKVKFGPDMTAGGPGEPQPPNFLASRPPTWRCSSVDLATAALAGFSQPEHFQMLPLILLFFHTDNNKRLHLHMARMNRGSSTNSLRQVRDLSEAI